MKAGLQKQLDDLPQSARAQGCISASFETSAGKTFIKNLYEAGGWRLKHPKGRVCEAVLVNTGGGILGGDQIDLSFDVAAHAAVMITSQAAEKIYKAQNHPAHTQLSLRLGACAQLAWLPQEMIFFDGAHFKRRIDVDMDEQAELTMIETNVFGRLAMGEEIDRGHLHDRWRIRRGRRLVFAEDLWLEGQIAAHLAHCAIGNGARASALLLHISPRAMLQLELLRQHLSDGFSDVEWGLSAWNDMLVMRMLSVKPEHIRALSHKTLTFLLRHDLPRVWQ
jgi:urease accessory protein